MLCDAQGANIGVIHCLHSNVVRQLKAQCCRPVHTFQRQRLGLSIILNYLFPKLKLTEDKCHFRFGARSV